MLLKLWIIDVLNSPLLISTIEIIKRITIKLSIQWCIWIKNM